MIDDSNRAKPTAIPIDINIIKNIPDVSDMFKINSLNIFELPTWNLSTKE
jgi:uncharacterized ParB-like nuclease family protein